MKHSVADLLAADTTSWDRLIAADLAFELENHLGERAQSLPEMRRFLAVKGYREMRRRLEAEIAGLVGNEAIRRMAFTFRAFALERPGLAAATFRSPHTDCQEWRREGELLATVAIGVFQSAGVPAGQAAVALRILRAVVRGFVLHEMSASFMDDVDYEKNYAATVEVFLHGLEILHDGHMSILHSVP